jgi:hypothetical protein
MESNDGTGRKISVPFFARTGEKRLLVAQPEGSGFAYTLESDMLYRLLPKKMEDLR